jgi:hypothetical protein
LVRVVVEALARAGNADAPEKTRGLVARRAPRESPVHA